jgi:hypothetical protein
VIGSSSAKTNEASGSRKAGAKRETSFMVLLNLSNGDILREMEGAQRLEATLIA